MTNKTKHLTRWFAVNSTIMAMAIGAVFYKIAPLEHMITFMVWFWFVIGLVYLSEAACNEIFKKESATFEHLPHWVDITYDISMIAILLYPGWFATAAAYAVFAVLQQSAYTQWKKRQEKENEQANSSR